MNLTIISNLRRSKEHGQLTIDNNKRLSESDKSLIRRLKSVRDLDSEDTQ